MVLLWSLVVFVLVALSARQRWRYYLPLCVPVALLIARWLSGHRVWRETTNTVAIGAVIATLMAAGGTYATARDNHGTHLRMVASALGGVPGPLFALDAPELVFSFYLKRPVQAISSMDEVRAVDPPVYVLARDRPAESFERVAASIVRGRPFGLWVKR